MKSFLLSMLLAGLCLFSREIEAASVMITGQTAGPTPFISNLQLTATPPASIKSIEFNITPKAGSVTRPVAATYTSEYLEKRGYYNLQTGAILLPVFGLYANFANTVSLTYTFTDNSVQQDGTMVSTTAFTSSCGYATPTVVQPRTNSTTLSYDYFLVKNQCGNLAPIIIDTDGEVRWVGPTGFSNFGATLFQNSIYIANSTSLYRMELDGTIVPLRDYSSAGVINFHHNADFGKHGILFEADTAAQLEAFIMEVDTRGNILRSWNLADIISAAMTAGGDDPTQFVKPAPNDWFHNNSTTYKRSDDSLLVSSRENFVIALDYASSSIKWILGDTTKHWHQFPSLSNYALTLGVNTLPPIGEHALSITKDDNLLLFDNGRSSIHHTPAGADRAYSAPRKYQINTQSKVATELWNYESNQAFYSPFCSSVYEDASSNYVVDYAILNLASPPILAEILGLDASGTKIFHYRYETNNCDTAFNSIPIHFEQMLFNISLPPRSDFNADTFNDYLLSSANSGVTAIWHLNGAVHLSGLFGPTLPGGWSVASVADVNIDGEPDYVLFNASTRQTAVWFLNNNVKIAGQYGPTLPAGWSLIALADMNNDGHPDLVLFSQSARRTAVWYMNGAVRTGSAYGPSLPSGWTLNDAVDFNADDKPDFLLANANTRQTAVAFLNGVTYTGTVFGPTLPSGWILQGSADFNTDGKPDYVLFEPGTRRTALWYLSGSTRIGGAYGPTLAAGYSLAFP
jgi:arylsulfate sulfotransferase